MIVGAAHPTATSLPSAEPTRILVRNGYTIEASIIEEYAPDFLGNVELFPDKTILMKFSRTSMMHELFHVLEIISGANGAIEVISRAVGDRKKYNDPANTLSEYGAFVLNCFNPKEVIELLSILQQMLNNHEIQTRSAQNSNS